MKDIELLHARSRTQQRPKKFSGHRSITENATSIAAIATLLLACANPSGAQDADSTKLAKDLVNPVASLISVPFQANEDFGFGPTGRGYKFTLNIQPVVPLSISKDWNIVIRTILPIVSQHDIFYDPKIPVTQNRNQDGLSDTLQSFFFGPKAPGPAGLIWGVGPALLYPTGTHPFLGGGQWGAGPTVVGLVQKGPWTIGVLTNQIWSYAGDEGSNYLSAAFIQPFFGYTTKRSTTFTLNSESSYDWRGEQWTVPINLLVSQVFKIGKQPVSLQLGARYYAESPSNGPNWGVRLNFTLLFPTARPHAAQAAGNMIEMHEQARNFKEW